MRGLYVNNSSYAVGHIFAMPQGFVWAYGNNVSVPGDIVDSIVVVDEAYILT